MCLHWPGLLPHQPAEEEQEGWGERVGTSPSVGAWATAHTLEQTFGPSKGTPPGAAPARASILRANFNSVSFQTGSPTSRKALSHLLPHTEPDRGTYPAV